MGGGKGSSEDGRQVFVGNLSWETSWQDLKDHMSDAGKIEYCDVLHRDDGKHSGAGLVRFADSRDADRAINKLTDTELNGRQIFVREDREGGKINGSKGKGKKGDWGKDSWSTPWWKGKGKGKSDYGSSKGGNGKGNEWSVWVGPLDWGLSWQDLKDAFSDYNPTHTDVGEFRDGKNRGFGIIKFATATEAEAAINAVRRINGQPVEVKWDNESFSKGGKKGKGKKKGYSPY